MRTYPTDKSDLKELKKLNAKDWMVETLKLNPSYVHWGPHEDYMWTKEGQGWNSSVFVESWKEFKWELDELNECVNFYFHLHRDLVECTDCDHSGYNPATKRISDDWYDFDNTGRRWCDNITQDEVDALVENGRLREWDKDKQEWKKVPRTAAEVNAANKRGSMDLLHTHDAINRWICVETRAKRLGVYGKCKRCGGEGTLFTSPAAKLQLTLWIIHPRKGCSRGVEIKEICKEDLPSVYEWLFNAATRNAKRFSKVANLHTGGKK